MTQKAMHGGHDPAFVMPWTSVTHASLPGVPLIVTSGRLEGQRQVCKVAWLEEGQRRDAEFPCEELGAPG